jgi:AGZA family xanthine/uracil permease-like MFS transporter
VAFVSSVVPMQAGVAIVLWIGIIITAQAFQATPREHAPAVAIGLFPAIAAWGATVVQGAFIVANGSLQTILQQNHAIELSGFLLHGMLLMERGFIFTCMIVSAITVFLIENKFYTAAIWSLAAAVFAYCGLMHAYQISGNQLDFLFVLETPAKTALNFRADMIAIGYLLFAALFAGIGFQQQTKTP